MIGSRYCGGGNGWGDGDSDASGDSLSGASSGGVSAAFRPDGLVFTRPCKIFKEKKLEDKRIHDNLILLRVTFSIILLESLRTIAR